MVSIFDVAKYILERQDHISKWRLHGLCYYAQAMHYVWEEKRLIKEEFQAWDKGVVCPELYAAHKGKFFIGADDIQGDTAALADNEKESINVVIRDLGDYPPYRLVGMIKSELPYQNTPLKGVISLESMGEYYGSLI